MKCPMCSEEIPAKSAVCPLCKSNLAGGGETVVSPEKAQEIKAKIGRLNALSFVFALPGLGLEFAAGAIAPKPELVPVLQLSGAVLVIVGFCIYATMKGRNAAWGLMGIFSCLGLIFLALMGKCCHNCQQVASYGAKECTKCHAPM